MAVETTHESALVAVAREALARLIKLSDKFDALSEPCSQDLRHQADRFLLGRDLRDLADAALKGLGGLYEREQERLWALMDAQGVPRLDVETPEGAYTLTQSHAIYPGLNKDLVGDDPAARAVATHKVIDFVTQVGDEEALVDTDPRIRWNRMRAKEFVARYLDLHAQGELVIPPELDLTPRRIVQRRRKSK